MSQASFKNKLIRRMSPEDFERLNPHFDRVEMNPRQTLLRRGDLIDYVYFPESGHASTLAKVSSSNPIEAGMIGSEGMTEFTFSGRATCQTIVQMAGEAIRIRRTILQEAVQESLPLALLLLKHQQALTTQIAYTALSHGAFSVRERLPRFILMAQDRAEGNDLPLVHEFFSWMLAIRRAGVTECFKYLVAEGAVETRRGKVSVLDREKLIELANGSYGVAEAEYERIFAAPVAAPKPTAPGQPWQA